MANNTFQRFTAIGLLVSVAAGIYLKDSLPKEVVVGAALLYGVGACMAVVGNRFASLMNGGENHRQVNAEEDTFINGLWNSKGAASSMFASITVLAAVPEAFKMIMSYNGASREVLFVIGAGALAAGLFQTISGINMFNNARAGGGAVLVA